jgi:hypothetical protein
LAFDKLPTDPAVNALVRLFVIAEQRVQDSLNAAAAQSGTARYRRQRLAVIQAETKDLLKQVRDEVPEIVAKTYAVGNGIAKGVNFTRNTPKLDFGAGQSKLMLDHLVQNMLSDLEGGINTMNTNAAGVLRQIGLRQTALHIIEGSTRQEASKAMSAQILRQGLISSVDKAGRHWKLSTYSANVIHTTTREAITAGTVDGMKATGRDLVEVFEHAHPCDLCSPYLGKTYSLTGKTPGYTILLKKPPYHMNCVIEGTEVQTANIGAAYKAWYSGPVVHLTTDHGHRLTVTLNHPVMTQKGWLPAKQLCQGDYVYSSSSLNAARSIFGDENFNDVPTSIEQIFRTLSSVNSAISRTSTGDDFHNDGRHLQSKVDVVFSYGQLLDKTNREINQEVSHWDFVGPYNPARMLTTNRTFTKLLIASYSSFRSIMGSFDLLSSLVFRHLSPLEQLSFTVATNSNPLFNQHGSDHSSAYIKLFSQSFFRNAMQDVKLNNIFSGRTTVCGLAQTYAALSQMSEDGSLSRVKLASDLMGGQAAFIKPNELVNVSFGEYSGHVYDLTSKSGMYSANDLIISNCRCVLGPSKANFELMEKQLAGYSALPDLHSYVS